MRLKFLVGLNFALDRAILQLADRLLLRGQILFAGFSVMQGEFEVFFERVAFRLSHLKWLAGSFDHFGETALSKG